MVLIHHTGWEWEGTGINFGNGTGMGIMSKASREWDWELEWTDGSGREWECCTPFPRICARFVACVFTDNAYGVRQRRDAFAQDGRWKCPRHQRQPPRYDFTVQYYHYYTRSLHGLFSRTTWVSRYQIGETSLDLNEARDDGVLGMVAASSGPFANNLHLAPDRQPPQHLISQFLQAGCSLWRPTNSVKALIS